MRWATFDCYGTLVDWNAGLRAVLERLFGPSEGDRLLARYHEVEPRVQAEHPERSYREVMATVLETIASDEGVSLDAGDRDALGQSLPSWPVFPEVPSALAESRSRGWSLAMLTNSDRDFIEASISAIGVPFDLAVVASEIDSYKPALAHWERFDEQTGADRARHVHVAQSNFHDIGPARELGLPSIWINRLGERAVAVPTRELPDLRRLPDTLDELVPA
jgi:2-haloacid dehalogenase